ncbi:hypothetical protein EON67_01710 [archaeon]|nr:MAG: hypothetical protein EON67_01710 [archaeon]
MTPVLMNFLQVAQYDRLVFESAWALTNIASGTSDNTRTVVAAGAIPVFVRLLNHSDVNVCEQATWALGNIAGDSAALRDAVLHAGALPGVLRHLAYGTKLSFIRNGTWTLSNFLRSKPTPEQQYINDILPMLGRLLYSDDVDVLTDALWALSYLTDGDDPALLQCALEAGVCSRLAVLLRHPSANIVTPALRVVGNIVTGDEIQTQVMINVGALESLLAVLSGSRKNLRKEACWAISNIMAGNTAQIQAVLDTGIVAKLVDLLSNGSLEVRREACWALSNASTAGTTDQLIFLIQQSCIAPLTEVIKSQEVDMCIVAMEGIDNLLVAMAGCSDSSLLTHTKELCEEADLPNILYDRIDHPNRGTWLARSRQTRACAVRVHVRVHVRCPPFPLPHVCCRREQQGVAHA